MEEEQPAGLIVEDDQQSSVLFVGGCHVPLRPTGANLVALSLDLALCLTSACYHLPCVTFSSVVKSWHVGCPRWLMAQPCLLSTPQPVLCQRCAALLGVFGAVWQARSSRRAVTSL